MNEPTREDYVWAEKYIETLGLHDSFQDLWTSVVGNKGYDKSVWLRRETALYRLSKRDDPEKRHITVTVSGTVNSGKTTVANLIKNTLQGLGIFCTIEDKGDAVPPLHLTSQVLADGVVVDIKTVQVCRGRMG
jgi:hypothetical protein